MSFTCAVTKEVVEGKKQVLVPTLKRKVNYQRFVGRKDNRTGQYKKILVGKPSEGWEVSTEVSTTVEHEAELINSTQDNFESEIKTIYVRVPNSVLVKEKEKNQKANPYGNYLDL